MPKVTVVIPAYNTEAYLAETLQSVFAQTFRDYEVIVVDDGSTDGTLPTARRFEPRVKVLSKPNGGPASARNLAIRQSDSEYIAFLDSDDLWVDDKLVEQVMYLDNNPQIGLVYGEALMFKRDGGAKQTISKIGYTGDPTFRQLLYGDFIPNSTVMIRRTCIDKVGQLDESRELLGVEDYEYWMRIARSFPIAGMPRPLAYYRIRPGNLFGDGRNIDKGLSYSLAALRAVESYYPEMWREHGVDPNLLFARLYVRAGFAWKQHGEWAACLHKFREALSYSRNPRVFRWLVAATLLQKWS